MANDCLVTKLKASVQNTDLLKVGEMRLYKTEVSSDLIIDNSLLEITYKGIGGTTFDVGNVADGSSLATGVNEYTSPANQLCYIHNVSAEGCISVCSKYDINRFKPSGYRYDKSTLKYMSNLTYFESSANDYVVTVNALDLPKSIVTLKCGSYFVGVISDLSDFINLTYLEGAIGMTGDLKDLAVGQISNGRLSGEITGRWWEHLTFVGDSNLADGYDSVSWAPVTGTSNYTVTVKHGPSAGSTTYSRTITIDASGNIIS